MNREKWHEDRTLLERSGSWNHSWTWAALRVEASRDGNLQTPIWTPELMNGLQISDQHRAATMSGSSRMDDPHEKSSMSLAEFVQRRFVPEYVATKRIAGRAHFQALLKHILPPETVARAFGKNPTKSTLKLRAIPGWPYMDSLRLEDVTPERIQRLITAALKSGYSTQTVTHLRNVIRAIFWHAIRSGCYSGTNPAMPVKLPAMARKEAHTLTLTQLKQVMQWMRYPEKEIALFALVTEMNVAEICGLQWKYVNLSNERHVVEGDRVPPRTIAVRKQSYRGEFGPVLGMRKRFVPIPDLLYSILQQHRTTSTGPDDFVIASRSGTPIYPDNIAARRLKWIGKALEMPWLSWSVFNRTRTNLIAEFGRHLHKELEKALPLNTVAIRPLCAAHQRAAFDPNQKTDHHLASSSQRLDGWPLWGHPMSIAPQVVTRMGHRSAASPIMTSLPRFQPERRLIL